MIYVFLGKGFEEMEAIAPTDLMRRAGIEVMTAGIGGTDIEGAHGIVVKADCTVEDIDIENVDMIILPGGMGGVDSIMGSEKAMGLVAAANEQGKKLAAICAAPMILGKLGVLQGKKAVIYPGMEEYLTGATPDTGAKTCVDGNVVTGQGPGAALDFGLALVEYIAGREAAEEVRGHVHY